MQPLSELQLLVNKKSVLEGIHRLITNFIRSFLCDNWKPSFLPRLIFNWRTFSRRVTAPWSYG